MPFRSMAESRTREAARLAEIQSLVNLLEARTVRTPAEAFIGGTMYLGFYAGTIAAIGKAHIALISDDNTQGVVLPFTGTPNMLHGARVAVMSWNSRHRKIVTLTENYDWMDAFDDWGAEVGREYGYARTLIEEGIRNPIFVVNHLGRIPGFFRDLQAEYGLSQ